MKGEHRLKRSIPPHPNPPPQGERGQAESSSPTRIGIAIVEHDNRFLIGVRGEDSPLSGFAEFPGGKCQDQESPADCAVRECREETGLNVRAVKLLEQRTHEYPHATVELHFWLSAAVDPATVAEDHQGFRWVHRDELKILNFPEANRAVVGSLTRQSD